MESLSELYFVSGSVCLVNGVQRLVAGSRMLKMEKFPNSYQVYILGVETRSLKS